MEFETIIGLETHVQLSTESKIFSTASAKFGGEPNEYVDAVTLGLPGSLPVVNRRVIEFAVMLGLATHCEIRKFNRFARKHYFYPDLPKGYQISQYDEPICERGHIKIHLPEGTRTIGITRIHMEEDAGKNIHDNYSHASLVDLNRAGVPLLEVVSEPDLRSPAEASAYLKTIRQIVRFLGISDGNMEEGSLRCDANISLRPVGSLKFGTRTEIKNLNSFKFVEKAIEYEVARQLSLLKAGKEIQQQTLLFDSATGTTRPMRGKEESSDYRYFPDPDLPPVIVEESWVRRIASGMPKLPEQYEKELVEQYGLTPYDAGVLTAERASVEYFYNVLARCPNARLVCNWICSELFGYLNKEALPIEQCPISAEALSELLNLIEEGTLSGKMAKMVFEEMCLSLKRPSEIVKEKGLKQITGEEEILAIIKKVLDDHAAEVQKYLSGNERVYGFFVGQTMKLTKGSANPDKVNELLKRELTARKG